MATPDPRCSHCVNCANTSLCDSCFQLHRQETHTPLSLEDTAVLRYQQRRQVFEAGRQELLHNLNAVDQCCSEVTDAVERLIIQARKYKEEFIAEMQTWKAQFSTDIHQSIAEVEATLSEENVSLTGPYSMSLRHYTPGSLTLFTFQVTPSPLITSLSSLTSTSFTPPRSQFQSTDLFWVTENTIDWFDVSNENRHPSTPLTTSIQVNESSRWVVFEPDKVVVCGGSMFDEDWKSAYMVGKTGRVERLPEMMYGHSCQGVSMWKGTVHVFGSFHEIGGKQCES